MVVLFLGLGISTNFFGGCTSLYFYLHCIACIFPYILVSLCGHVFFVTAMDLKAVIFCISLMDTDAAYILKCLLVICSSSQNCLKFISPFTDLFTCLGNFGSSLYVLDIKPLSQV